MSAAGSRGRQLSGALAGVATAIALVSAWHSVGHIRRLLEAGVAHRLAPTTRGVERRIGGALGLDGQIFDFFAAYLQRGDRVYFQVMPSGYSPEFDLPGIIEALGR